MSPSYGKDNHLSRNGIYPPSTACPHLMAQTTFHGTYSSLTAHSLPRQLYQPHTLQTHMLQYKAPVTNISASHGNQIASHSVNRLLWHISAFNNNHIRLSRPTFGFRGKHLPFVARLRHQTMKTR